MNVAKMCLLIAGAVVVPAVSVAGPGGGAVSGKVTLVGNVPKPRALDVSKEPTCMKAHWNDPLYPENVLTGPGNMLRNVVVYISAGESDTDPVPATAVNYDQQGCHYTTHVAVLRVGQEVKISNSDPIAHNIHPIARVNREWNRIQLPGVPPFFYAFDNEEIIPVKCNIHPWMQGYFVVLKTSHYAVTGEDGHFTLPNLPPGHYVITAWHETYGTQTKEITVGGSAAEQLDFTFTAKP